MENDLKVPKPTNNDSINKVLKVLISPLINGTAMEILNAITIAPIERRRDIFFEDICFHIKKLESKIEELKPERLSENELFITVLLKSFQAIIKEHQKEKIDAFKNAVINTVTIESISENYKLLFLSYLESFTVLHLQILKSINDSIHSIANPKESLNSFKDFDILYREFIISSNDKQVSKETFLSIIKELQSKDLIRVNNHYSNYDSMLIDSSDFDLPLDDMFIAFITGYFK
jgi:hypothetical protein